MAPDFVPSWSTQPRQDGAISFGDAGIGFMAYLIDALLLVGFEMFHLDQQNAAETAKVGELAFGGFEDAIVVKRSASKLSYNQVSECSF
jgi:hypothetical protein